MFRSKRRSLSEVATSRSCVALCQKREFEPRRPSAVHGQPQKRRMPLSETWVRVAQAGRPVYSANKRRPVRTIVGGGGLFFHQKMDRRAQLQVTAITTRPRVLINLELRKNPAWTYNCVAYTSPRLGAPPRRAQAARATLSHQSESSGRPEYTSAVASHRSEGSGSK